MPIVKCYEVKILKKTMLTIFTIFLIITSGLNVVSANMTEYNITNNDQIEPSEEKQINENTEETDEIQRKRTNETVIATCTGYQNITFNDSYNGYCANKYLKDAKIGEKFIVQDTSKLINPQYNESVGNYLKILFVDHYDLIINDKEATTLTIWEFTDNFYKTDYYRSIVPIILKAAEEGRMIPDKGEVKKINETTEAIFDFEYLESMNDTTQNFFGYKITYRDIISEMANNTGSLGNSADNQTPENNTTENNTTENNTQQTQKQENNTQQTQKQENNTYPTKIENVLKKGKSNPDNHFMLLKHETGKAISLLIGIILILGCVLVIAFRRD